jgi:hypothetical protein
LEIILDAHIIAVHLCVVAKEMMQIYTKKAKNISGGAG